MGEKLHFEGEEESRGSDEHSPSAGRQLTQVLRNEEADGQGKPQVAWWP